MQEWSFGSASKVDPFTHRVRRASDTLTQARACAPRVPITRVSDLAPLDRLRLPVYSATTPLARDLTTHLGKGMDDERAQVSAMMEAIERVCAERVERPVRRLTFASMARSAPAVDPRTLDLPEDSSFHEDRAFDWTQGWDLVGQEPVWIPVDLVISPPEEGLLRHVDTNGLASGNTLLEATVHALCEVIERDVFGLHLFCASFAETDEPILSARPIDTGSLPPECQAWASRLAAHGLRIETEVLESEIRVPVFRSVLIDHDCDASRPEVARSFVGLGASPNAAMAAARSIAEAVQSRMAIVQGARDSFNAVAVPARGSRPGRRDTGAHARVPLGSVPTLVTSDLLDDLRFLLDALVEAGFTKAIAVNLSRDELGVAVVRVRVPGLTSFAVNRRRVGWRCLRYLL